MQCHAYFLLLIKKHLILRRHLTLSSTIQTLESLICTSGLPTATSKVTVTTQPSATADITSYTQTVCVDIRNYNKRVAPGPSILRDRLLARIRCLMYSGSWLVTTVKICPCTHAGFVKLISGSIEAYQWFEICSAHLNSVHRIVQFGCCGSVQTNTHTHILLGSDVHHPHRGTMTTACVSSKNRSSS